MDALLLQKEFDEFCPGVKKVYPSDKDYNKDRIIDNLRFNYKPFAIAYCANAGNVSCCIKFCIKTKTPFRIRSGGHQHEGMCSADNVLVIDLSSMNTIGYGSDNKTAWIPSGIPLKNVYKELEAKNRIIPGGGCGSVNIGGLTQGGGWGLSARKLGLTCDNITEAEVILANGDFVTLKNDRNDKHYNLFWAIKGGGGGNFGVVTRFKFNLTTLSGTLTTFSLCFTKQDMKKIVGEWAAIADTMDENLTTFCRLSVVEKDTDDKPSVLLAGQFFGTKENLLKVLKPFYDVATPFNPIFKSVLYNGSAQADGLMMEDSLALTSNLGLANMLQTSVPAAPTQTCDAPHPHKISSTFPRKDQDAALVNSLVDFLLTSKVFPNANTYLSLHGMGGAVRYGDNAFPWKHKKYMLQFQAWWANPADSDTINYMNWIEKFRQTLLPYTEGSFINFPDVNLVKDYKTPQGRLALLKIYYGANLADLQNTKAIYDKGELFNFGMGIPPAG